jgi:hypothetical protein
MNTLDFHSRLVTIFCALIVFIGVGCGRDADRGEAGTQSGSANKPIEQMSSEEVIVSFNGVALTREKHDDAVGVKELLHKLARPQARTEELKSYRAHWSRAVVSEFLARQAVLQTAREKGHRPSAAAIQTSRADLCKLLKVEDEALEKKFTELGRLGRGLQELIEENALIRSFREAEHQQKLTVSKEEVDEQLKKTKAYHERAEATNQLVTAKGKAICEQLKKGEDFIKLAGLYSETVDKPVGEWGTFLKGEIENVQIREAAFSLPVGAVSEPFDTEEGLVIIKVIERTQEVHGPTTVPSEPVTVKLGRIVLRLAEGGAHVSLPSREAVEKFLLNQKIKDLQNEWIPSLVAKARVEYPYGTNLWLNAKAKKEARPHKGKSRRETKEETK